MIRETHAVDKIPTSLSDRLRWDSPWRQALRRLRRNPSGLIGLTILAAMTIAHLGAPLFTDLDPTALDKRAILQAPSPEHPFGTDRYGRDLLSRVLYGGRISLLVASIVALVTTCTGVILGSLSGYFPRLDSTIMRIMDLVMAFPTIILAIAIVAILGPQLLNILIALVTVVTPRTSRVVRGVILATKEKEFVLAGRSVGAGDLRIIFRHLLPSAVPALLVRQTYVFGISILIEGGLNFLGVGVQPEIPTLGAVVAEGRQFLREMPWISFYAGMAIALLVLGINLLGDGLRDALDPRMKV